MRDVGIVRLNCAGDKQKGAECLDLVPRLEVIHNMLEG